MTAVLAEIVSGTEEISIVNCGHPPPLLITGTLGRFTDPPEASLPLGLAEFGPDGRKQCTVMFGPQVRMLFYTDGISEARDKAGTFYPVGRCATLLAGPGPRRRAGSPVRRRFPAYGRRAARRLRRPADDPRYAENMTTGPIHTAILFVVAGLLVVAASIAVAVALTVTPAQQVSGAG